LIYSNPGVENNSTALRSLVGGIQSHQRLHTGYIPKSRELNLARRSHSSFYNSKNANANKAVADLASQYRHNERLSETPSRQGARNSRSTTRLTAARLQDKKSIGLRQDVKSDRFNEVDKNSFKNSTTLSRANLANLEKHSAAKSFSGNAVKVESVHPSTASKRSRVTIRSEVRQGNPARTDLNAVSLTAEDHRKKILSVVN
jgi:hypothetical protein